MEFRSLRILVIGGSGLAGGEIVQNLAKNNEVHFTYNKNLIRWEGADGVKLNLEDSATQLIKDLKPEIIFHAASNPSVDWHEREKEVATRINIESTKKIVQEASDIGAKVVYLSTAFVFPGFGRSFSETDVPSPINFYGKTKFEAEKIVLNHPKNLVVRTDQIYGWAKEGQKKSFVVSVLEKIKTGQKAEVCSDWFNCPTYVKDLTNSIRILCEKEKTGVYHVVGPDFVDRYTWAKEIANVFDSDSELVVPIKSDSLKLPAMRPNARLETDKIRKEVGISLMGVLDGLKNMKTSE